MSPKLERLEMEAREASEVVARAAPEAVHEEAMAVEGRGLWSAQ